MDIKKSSFHPICDLKDKSNFKQFHLIERDGTIFERIFLDISDMSIREQLICLHYLKNYVKFFCQKSIGINILSRDNPWDFKIELSNKEIFNIEITSIADNSGVFEKFKREERYSQKSVDEKIHLHELIKLNNMFPNSDNSKKIQHYLDSQVSKKELVENPYNKPGKSVILSTYIKDKVPLENLLKESIQKKEAKKHLEKENTVLIIDNRTIIYEIPDLYSAIDSLQESLDSSNFREIWFYTGYCSDLNGNNAEFSLSPLKVTSEQAGILEKDIDKKDVNGNGIIYVNKDDGT